MEDKIYLVRKKALPLGGVKKHRASVGFSVKDRPASGENAPAEFFNGVYRIIDVNLNRLREGLRVGEEVVRFVKEEENYTTEFRCLRQKITKVLNSSKLSTRKLFSSRNINSDVGTKENLDDFKRKDYKDIFKANIQRVKESLRVLEEFLKLIDKQASQEFRQLRFKVYDLEKKIYLDIW